MSSRPPYLALPEAHVTVKPFISAVADEYGVDPWGVPAFRAGDNG